MSTNEQLLLAIKANDVERLKHLLDNDPDLVPNRPLDDQNPIIAAVYLRAEEALELLLSFRPVLNIFEAAAAGQLGWVRDIASESPELIDSHSHDGWTPLQLAAHFGHTEVAGALIGVGANVAVRASNGNENQALEAGIAGGAPIEMVDLLIESGADVNDRQAGGFTPLHAAAQNGDVTTVERLLAAGADTTARTDKGETPRALAEARGHSEVMALLDEA